MRYTSCILTVIAECMILWQYEADSFSPALAVLRRTFSLSPPRASTPASQRCMSSQILSNPEGNPVLAEDTNAEKSFYLRSAKSSCVYGVAPRTGPLNLAVASVANVTLEHANELIELGAVWARLETLTPDELLDLYNSDEDDDSTVGVSSSRALYADIDRRRAGDNKDGDDFDDEDDLDAYIARMEQIRYRRILTPTVVDAGVDLRIYTNPRRFTASCEDQMSRDRVLYQDTTFMVVDKPPLLPTQPDASNYVECCPGCVGKGLEGDLVDIQGRDVPRPLLCHRVDRVVGGCVVLAKDRNGQNVFLKLQRERKVRKVYLAVTQTPVPVGRHVHWMWAPQSARGKVGGPPCQLIRHSVPESRRKAREFWMRCILQVVECRPIQIAPELLQANRPPGTAEPDQSAGVYYQSVIRLVTGRKHQVRAQLASLGCPILFDTLYEPMSGLTLDDLDDATDENVLDKSVGRCRVPATPIGLQAHAISFEGVKAIAQNPWWLPPKRRTPL
jgi:23S rRNA-/tRNA-specific pseudouridylate synthase